MSGLKLWRREEGASGYRGYSSALIIIIIIIHNTVSVCVCVSCFYLFSFIFLFPLCQCNTEAVSYREEEEGRSAGIFKTIDNSNPDASSARHPPPPPRLSRLQRDESAFVDFEADPTSKNIRSSPGTLSVNPSTCPFSPPRSLRPSVLSVMFY